MVSFLIIYEIIYYKSNKKGEMIMKLKFQNSDVYLELERKQSRLWYTDTSAEYLCIFKFKNTLGIELLRIIYNEFEIIDILGMINNIIGFGTKFNALTLNPNNTSLNQYTLSISEEEDPSGERFIYQTQIIEVNPIYHTYIVRLYFPMQDYELIDFYDALYQTFIKDLSEDISELYNPENGMWYWGE